MYKTIASISAVGKEATRTQERQGENIDTERTHLNEVIHGSGDYLETYRQAFAGCDYYQSTDKYGRARKLDERTVKGIGFVMTASPESMDRIIREGREQEFIDECMKFIEETFPGCPFTAVVHRDETTLHVQGFIVPTQETAKGKKLNKGAFIQDRKALSKIQDRFAERMKPLGLERGANRVTEKATREQLSEYRETQKRLIHYSKAISKMQNYIEKQQETIEQQAKIIEQQKEQISTILNDIGLDPNYSAWEETR